MSNESTISFESLLEEFDLPQVEETKELAPKEQVPLEIQVEVPEESVEELTRKNIARSNRLLDMLEINLMENKDKPHPRNFEVAAKLIDSISTASNILTGIEITKQTFDLKERTLDLRKYEFDAKMASKDSKQNPESLTQNMNFFVGSREDIMALIKETGITNKTLEHNLESIAKD